MFRNFLNKLLMCGIVLTPFLVEAVVPVEVAYEKGEEGKDTVILENLKGIILLGSPDAVAEEGTFSETPITIKDLEVASRKPFLYNELNNRFIGRPLREETIVEIKKTIIDYYLAQGYPVIDVRTPPQDVTNGFLQLVVVEGKLGEIRSQGHKWCSPQKIYKNIHLQKGDVINVDSLSQDIAWVNRNPFRKVDVVFTPGTNAGTTDIELFTQDKWPYRFYAGIDNYGNDIVGNARSFVGCNLGDLFGLDHLLSYQFTSSFHFSRLQAHSLYYAAPLPCQHTIELYGGYSQVDADLNISATSEDGTSTKSHTYGHNTQFSLRYRYPFFVNLSRWQDVYVGFDYKNTDNSLIFGELTASDKSAALFQWIVGYSVELDRKNHQTEFTVELVASPFTFLPHQNKKDYEALRYAANPLYLYTRLNLSDTWYLPRGFELFSQLQAQLADTNLLPSEEFGLGGYDTVRGYDQRIVNGDGGFLVNLELYSPKISVLGYVIKKCSPRVQCYKPCKFFQEDALRFLVFLDYGMTTIHKTAKKENRNDYLFSVGPGLRYVIDPHLIMKLDVGIQLKKTGSENHRGSMAHFNLVASF